MIVTMVNFVCLWTANRLSLNLVRSYFLIIVKAVQSRMQEKAGQSSLTRRPRTFHGTTVSGWPEEDVQMMI